MSPSYSTSGIDRGSHILYIYNEVDKYIENALKFILDGLYHSEVILFVSSEPLLEQVKNELNKHHLEDALKENIFFAESTVSYLVNGHFSADKAGEIFELLQPYYEKGCSIRTWGHILLPQPLLNLEQIRIHECNSNDFVRTSGLISVCSYNGVTTPAYIQNELMKTHTHFMTDSDFQLSPLYHEERVKLLSRDELDRLRKLEKQNQELQTQNRVLVHSEQQIRTIIDQLPIPVIIRRRADVLFMNRVAQQNFSLDPQDGIDDKHLQLLTFITDYDNNPSLSDPNKVHEHQMTYKNGKIKYYLVKSIDLLFEGESAILHAFVDITYEKENERLIVRSEKMKITGELAASIAHELRNPLTAIKGFFQMLKSEGIGKELFFHIIEEELHRIEQISSEMLTLAKPHTEARRTHNLIKLLHDVKLLLTSQANMDNIDIILETNNEYIFFHCEDTKIKQVFINLIKNAMDAMRDGGVIVLKINKKPDHVQVQVIDQGKGIPEELLTKIGEPFYTTKEKGTGIGLMVCYQIIESHQGSIEVESKEGEGTTFTITLPLTE